MTDANPVRKVWLLSFAGTLLFFLVMTSGISSLGCACLEDAWEQYWPWFFYLGENVSHGRYPLWDPHSSCGFPFFANPQAGTFYPIYLLFGWMFGGGYRVFVGLWLGHWFFAIAGCFLLAKRLGLSPLGTFAASVTFGFSGFFIGNAEHTSFINAVAYVPWVLLALDLACEKHLAYALLAGVLLGIEGLSGYPGVFWYTIVMAILWALLRYGLSRKTAAVVCISVAVAGVVVSPAYVSFLMEGSGYTDRAGPLDLKTACDSGRFPFTAMISLIVPRFTVTFRDWIDCDVSMSNGYFGVLGLMSVLVTVLHAPLRKRWKWLLVWMLVAWLFSLGSAGGIRVIAYYVLPMLRYTRHSALFRAFWLMGGAILTGVVIDRLLSGSEEDRARIVSPAMRIIAGVLCACLCVSLWIVIVPDQDASTEGLLGTGVQVGIATACFVAFFLYNRMLVTRSLFAGLVALILVLDLAAHFSGNKNIVCAEGDGAVAAAGLGAVREAWARASFTGTEKRRDAPLIHPNQGLFDREFYVRSYNPASSPDYDLLVGGAVAGASSHPLRTPFLSVLENGPRFWLTPEVSYADVRDRRALFALRRTSFPHAVPIFVHSRVPRATDWPQAPVVPGTYGAVQPMRYLPELIVLRVEAPEDAWLFCAERYAPGWTAFVDGRRTNVHKADFCFRAVHVPKGVHEVRLQYDPWLHKPFWVMSWSTILVVLGAFLIIRVRGMGNDHL